MASNLNWSLLGGIPQQWGKDAGNVLEMDSSKMKEGFDAVNSLTDRLGRMRVRDKNSVAGLRERLRELEERKAELMAELMSPHLSNTFADRLTSGFSKTHKAELLADLMSPHASTFTDRLSRGYSNAESNKDNDYSKTLGVM